MQVVSQAPERVLPLQDKGQQAEVLSSHMWPLAQDAVVESQADNGFLVAAVFPLDLSCLHTPKSGQVVRGGWREMGEDWGKLH